MEVFKVAVMGGTNIMIGTFYVSIIYLKSWFFVSIIHVLSAIISFSTTTPEKYLTDIFREKTSAIEKEGNRAKKPVLLIPVIMKHRVLSSIIYLTIR